MTAHLSIAPSDGTRHLVSLDVCNSSGSFIAAGADLPLINECRFEPVVFETTGLIKGDIPHFASLLFSVQIEQPPRA